MRGKENNLREAHKQEESVEVWIHVLFRLFLADEGACEGSAVRSLLAFQIMPKTALEEKIENRISKSEIGSIMLPEKSTHDIFFSYILPGLSILPPDHIAKRNTPLF